MPTPAAKPGRKVERMKQYKIDYYYYLKRREMIVSATCKEDARRKFWLLHSAWDASIIQIKEVE